jgi:hypothetical protein
MKITGLLLLLLLPLGIFAQNITGNVVDKNTGKPIAFATVSSSKYIVSTSADGKFSLNVFPGDSIKISCIGYQKYSIGIGVAIPVLLTIYLQQTSILLQNVLVRLKRNPKIDSIRLRKQFAEVFNYQQPKFKDLFITVDPYKYVPYNYIDAPNSTADIVSINLLSVIGYLERNKDHTSKLQRVLVKDEETEYVDRRFSKQKISTLTNLEGDSLIDFMADYRPEIKQVKKMSDYDLILYIRASYADFIKTYDPKKRLIFGNNETAIK